MDKPIHIQVAEALGWAECEEVKGAIMLPESIHPCLWKGYGHPAIIGQKTCVPRYDLDWSATGPLVEKYGLGIHPFGNEWSAFPQSSEGSLESIEAPTPLLAICALIIELGKAGKL